MAASNLFCFYNFCHFQNVIWVELHNMYFVIGLWFLSLDIFIEDSSIFRCFTVYLSYSLMCYIPMYEYTTSLFMNCQWIFGYFPVLAVMNRVTVRFPIHVFLWAYVRISVGCLSRSRYTIFRFINQLPQPRPQGYSLSFMSNTFPDMTYMKHPALGWVQYEDSGNRHFLS